MVKAMTRLRPLVVELGKYGCVEELCGAVMRSHDSSRQWTFELVEEYDESEE